MQSGPSYLAAFGRRDGRLLWKHDRDLGAPEEAAQSYSTPVVVTGEERFGEPAEMIVVLGADHVTAHDAADGSEREQLAETVSRLFLRNSPRDPAGNGH